MIQITSLAWRTKVIQITLATWHTEENHFWLGAKKKLESDSNHFATCHKKVIQITLATWHTVKKKKVIPITFFG